ncbi:hypothetical protein K2X83_02990 [Patescibacteria group bacterium]|nr:hypothetical protein [Patescibacteria group bacterium]
MPQEQRMRIQKDPIYSIKGYSVREGEWVLLTHKPNVRGLIERGNAKITRVLYSPVDEYGTKGASKLIFYATEDGRALVKSEELITRADPPEIAASLLKKYE